AGDKHDNKSRCSDQSCRSQIDFAKHKRSGHADDRERNEKSRKHVAVRFFTLSKPGGKEKNCGDLCEFRWLKRNQAVAYPSERAIDANPDVRNVAKRQSSQREGEPKAPCFLPEVIVRQRCKNARHESNPNPNRLASNEKINVAVAVACVCACAEEHHNAN